MGITASKTDEVIRVVHIEDPDVDAHDPAEIGWIPITAAEVRPGATALGITPRSKRELMAADGDLSQGALNAGVAAYELAIAGLAEVGNWTRKRLTWKTLTRAEARDLVETLNVPAAIWQLGAMVRRLSAGLELAGDDTEGDLVPLAPAAAANGPAIAG